MSIETDMLPRQDSASEFAVVYRANVTVITAYFARRCSEPQTVADLTSDTFVEAIGSFRTFDPRRGSARGWLFGIARIIFARHCAAASNGNALTGRLAGQLELGEDQIDDLAGRIDAQREGHALLARCQQLPELERAAIELVDIEGLSPKEAAAAMKVSPGALRVRLFRARARLRKEVDPS